MFAVGKYDHPRQIRHLRLSTKAVDNSGDWFWADGGSARIGWRCLN